MGAALPPISRSAHRVWPAHSSNEQRTGAGPHYKERPRQAWAPYYSSTGQCPSHRRDCEALDTQTRWESLPGLGEGREHSGLSGSAMEGATHLYSSYRQVGSAAQEWVGPRVDLGGSCDSRACPGAICTRGPILPSSQEQMPQQKYTN